jgi:ribosomal protein S18 acetylase RimI-like enzyme
MNEKPKTTPHKAGVTIPERVGGPTEVNYGDGGAPDFGPLARDRFPIRAMKENDRRALVEIDRLITGRDRSDYFDRKLEEALYESDVRVSLVADLNDEVLGFAMARVDFGEFGRIGPVAVLDTIGVHPDFRSRGIGRALLSQLFMNLMSLRVETIRTEIGWDDHGLLAFADRCGFRPSQRLCLEYAIADEW